MIINETYEQYKNRVFASGNVNPFAYYSIPFEKDYLYVKVLDKQITQGNSAQVIVPISLTSGITISFFSNEDYWVFDLTDTDITVTDVITINLSSIQTNKFQPGILSLNIRQNGNSYSYLVGEVLKGHFNQISHY